jgi:hypothetical protein
MRKRGELVAVPAMGDAYFARRLAGFLLAQLSFKTGDDETPARRFKKIVAAVPCR